MFVAFVMTKHIFCHDKSRLVVTNNIFCHNKHNFIATKLLLRQAYFCHNKRHVLSWQTHVCCDKQNFCRDWNDTCGSSRQWYLVTLSSSPSPLQQDCYPLPLHKDCSTILLHQDSSPHTRTALPSPCTSTRLPLPRTSPDKTVTVGWAFKTPHCVPGLSPPFKPRLLSPSYIIENSLLLSTELPGTPLALHLRSAFTCSFRIQNLYCLWITQKFALRLHKKYK